MLGKTYFKDSYPQYPQKNGELCKFKNVDNLIYIKHTRKTENSFIYKDFWAE